MQAPRVPSCSAVRQEVHRQAPLASQADLERIHRDEVGNMKQSSMYPHNALAHPNNGKLLCAWVYFFCLTTVILFPQLLFNFTPPHHRDENKDIQKIEEEGPGPGGHSPTGQGRAG